MIVIANFYQVSLAISEVVSWPCRKSDHFLTILYVGTKNLIHWEEAMDSIRALVSQQLIGCQTKGDY